VPVIKLASRRAAVVGGRVASLAVKDEDLDLS